MHEASLAVAGGNADADALALIQLITSGSPITEDVAETRLSHRMARWHGPRPVDR